MATSATIGAAGIIYLIADKIRFESDQARKPWQQHPLVRFCIVATAGILGPVAVTFLASSLLLRLGVPTASTLAPKIGCLVTVLALLLTLGRLDRFPRHLTPDTALKLSKLVAAETFFQQRFHAWWLPRVIIALVVSANSPLLLSGVP